MSISASQADAFYEEVARDLVVWTIKDEGGFPSPRNTDGARVQPFWSSRSRAANIVKTVDSYRGFSVVDIPWSEFRECWVPGLSGDGVLMGVNWSGPRATGFDIIPEEVERNVEVRRQLRAD